MADVMALAIFMAFVGATRTAGAQGPPYSFTKIQVPGSSSTDAGGINTSGQVVGTYRNADGTFHGFVFDGTTYSTVDFPGASFTYLFGIDASGRAVGSYSLINGLGPYHGFQVKNGTFDTFDFPDRETDGPARSADLRTCAA